MSSPLKQNTEKIQNLLNTINSLPDAGSGIELPELSTPASASDILASKEAIDSNGNKITGTIATKTSSSLTANGATVTVPAGYYASQATKSVATATQATPTVGIDSAGKITASATQTAGYVSAGTKTGTKQLTTKAATTYTPTTSDQSIASGTYLTGTQTIKGDGNLKAENIKSGVSIFGVSGTHSGGENLDSVIAEQQALITELSSVLDNKASGGGASVETCSLTFIPSGTNLNSVCAAYTAYENDEITYKTLEGARFTNGELTIHPIKNTLIWCFGRDSNTGITSTVLRGEVGVVNFINNPERVNGHWQFFIFGDATMEYNAPCFIYNTKITLANNLKKAVQDITYDDELLVWDFDNGCYASAKPLWIKKKQTINYYYRCTFENGLVLNLVGSNGKCHRIFSIDDNRFESATDCVDKMVMTEFGATKLLSCEKIEETVDYYNIITNYHMNLFANSVMTSCRLNNLYQIENMKFIKEERECVDVNNFSGVCAKFYEGLRLSECNKEDIEWINNYVERLALIMQDGGVCA